MWHVIHPKIKNKFPSLEMIFDLSGKIVSQSSTNDVIFLDNYYIKRYYTAGKKIRKYFLRSKARGEWENNLWFQKLDIPTVKLLAYGESGFSFLRRGALITEAIPNTLDLLQHAKQNTFYFQNYLWRRKVFKKIAQYLKKLHQHQFIHYDLKWRNILVTLEDDPKVYFFDCPIGRKRSSYFYRYGVKKDLRNLDEPAQKYLCRKERLRFYAEYLRA